MSSRSCRVRAAFVALLACELAACAAFRPQPSAQPAFLARAQHETRDGVRVGVVALGRDESRRYFGVDLAAEHIQPVWLQVDNGSPLPLILLPSSIDPDYFSAQEAAYQVHRTFGGATNARIDDFFAAQTIDSRVPAGAARSGFVFTQLDEGAKYVTVQLWGPRTTETFRFVVDVPGLTADSATVDFDTLYAPDQIVDIDDEPALRVALEHLPPYTSRADGSGQGDALNFVVVGTREQVGGSLVATGWHVTEALGVGAGWKTFKSFLFGGRYRHAPMSALYVFGRPQDAGFQKARESIHQRNHLRVWQTPLRYRGRPVWLGAISRDIGVYFTLRSWSLTTHAIDPDLDDARDVLTQDLLLSQNVEALGHVSGIGARPREDPYHNLMNAPYWTDGRRAVYFLGDEPTALDDVRLLDWALKHDQTTEQWREEAEGR